MSPQLTRLIALLLGVLIGLGLAELIVRSSAVDLRLLDPLVDRQVADLEVHRPSADGELIYELVPGTAMEGPLEGSPLGDLPRDVHINSLGHRDPERRVEREPGSLRVLALGGSNTYGALVADAETWPAQLERELAERLGGRPVEVWNLGVSGYNDRQKARLMELAVPRYHPDLVIWQIYNRGSRYLLAGDPLGPALQRYPDLLSDFLPATWLDDAWRRWGLVRLVRVFHARRRATADPDSWHRRRWRQADRLTEERVVALARRFASLPVVIFAPLGIADSEVERRGWPVLRLPPAPAEVGPGADNIHPPAPVYRWYAAELAGALLESGCLQPGAVPPPPNGGIPPLRCSR